MIVFVHIEKAAGTTLNHILRCNFPLAHYDVRPFSHESNHIFTSKDFRIALKINPFLKSISGHAIFPFVSLSSVKPELKYITLLRDPVQRYISRYYYLKHKFYPKLTFEQFLNDESTFNFQTKKIAGTEDIETAKTIIIKKFFLVGITEEFDTFLLFLKKKLNSNFNPGYKKQNTANQSTHYKRIKQQLINNFHHEIIERNKLDIKLYHFVKCSLLPEFKKTYGKNFESDLAKLQKYCKTFQWPLIRYIDYLYRKIYIDPVSGLIRVTHGLPYKGSY